MDGFLRRGLVGTLLWPLGCGRFDPHIVWVIQYAVLAAALAALLWLGRRGPALIAVCVFFVTDAGTLFFNEVGYPDQLLLLITLACIFLLGRGRPWACATLMAVALLIHEEAVVTVLPVVAVRWLRLPPQNRPSLARLLLPSALVLAALAAFSTSLPFPVLKRYDDLSILCGHPVGRRDFLLYYGESAGQQVQFYYHTAELVQVVLPLVAGLALFVLAGGAFPAATWPERLVALLACVAPLALGYVGTDKNRWVMLTLVQLLILLGMADRGASEMSGRVGRVGRFASAIPLLVVVASMHIRLFDHFFARPLRVTGLERFPAIVWEQLSRPPVQ